jgi:hypothetical protein
LYKSRPPHLHRSTRRGQDQEQEQDDEEEEEEEQINTRESLGFLDIRRRSASSPGPEPPGRFRRMRGLTISEMENASGGGKGEYLPRAKVRGFGVDPELSDENWGEYRAGACHD